MSRPRSGRFSVGGAAGRTPAGRPGIFVQSPQSDVYVALLGLALAAMVIGCLLLVLILRRYDFKTKVSAVTPAAPSAIAAPEPPSPVIWRILLT